MEIKEITDETVIDYSMSTGAIVGAVFATLTVVPMLVWALIASNNWAYNSTMDQLAEELAKKFESTTKFKLIYEVNRHYTQMVTDMEVKNEFVIEDTQK